MIKKLILVFTSLILAACGGNDLADSFGEFTGTMVVHDQSRDETTIFNHARAETRFTPCSTFKIPHSLIALDLGIVPDVTTVVAVDTASFPAEADWPQQWLGSHTLATAIKYSVVPVYRTLASQIGPDRMQPYLEEFKYGNADISSGIDKFWLGGSLKISATEQVDFLEQFHSTSLDIPMEIVNAVKGIIVQEQTDDYTLSYKTGAGYLDTHREVAIGWLVGYVERDENVCYFAMNIEAPTFEEVLAPRISITRQILAALDIL